MASTRKRSTAHNAELNIKIRKRTDNVCLSIVVNNKQIKINSEIGHVEQRKDDLTQNLSYHQSVKWMQSALTNILLVDALEPISALKKRCALLGLKGNFDHPQADDPAVSPKCHGEYEVENILDHDTERHLYFIKWKGYGTEFNTWEPIDHLGNVPHLTYNFRLMERSVSADNKIAYKKLVLLNCLLNELLSSPNQDPYILLKLSGESAGMEYKRDYVYSLKKQLKIKSAFVQQNVLIRDETFQLNYCCLLDKAMEDIGIGEAFQSVENLSNAMNNRKKFVKCLKIWEVNINRLILEQEGCACATIEIENNWDLESPFEDFTYITTSIPRTDVDISEEPLLFCECDDCGSNFSTCCPSINESNHAYDGHDSLKSMKQVTIFECNTKCKCPSTCPNRVIQNGGKFKLGIFKTSDGRGWGVRALEPIPKGKFIVEYVGEVITEREAQDRAVSGQNPFGKSYLFDMEYEVGTNCDYLLDGAKFGNVSRFINHSCSPNMEVYPFWIGNPDMKMPRISFFSKKIIANGEELTFDYRMSDLISLLHCGNSTIVFSVVGCIALFLFCFTFYMCLNPNRV